MNEVLKELDKTEDLGQPDVDKANPEKVAKVLDNSDNVLPGDFECKEADEKNTDVNIFKAKKYTEEKQTDEKLQAQETLFSKQKSSVLKFNNSGTIYQDYEQVGKIEKTHMTGAILDFTGSMQKEQIQQVIDAILSLSKSGLIKSDTIFNVMYDIPDREKKISNKETQTKLESISFGENGNGLKKLLVEKGLVSTDWKVEKKGTGSTPLYSAILKNLMNPAVREATVFTDGSSDLSAQKKIGLEEKNTKESRDQMIRLCNEYDKKINIIVFNIDEEHVRRVVEMKKYFKDNNAEKFISITNIGDVSNEQLSGKLAKEISQKYSNVTIYEDPDLENRELSIDEKGDLIASNNIQKPFSDLVLEKNIFASYNQNDKSYAVDLYTLFPDIELSQAEVSYKINSYNSISQNEIYEEKTKQNNTYIIDTSGSMGLTGASFFKSANLSSNPDLSYDDLQYITKSVRGFKTENKAKIFGGKPNVIHDFTNTGEDVEINFSNVSLDKLNIKYNNERRKVFSLVLKYKIQKLQKSDNKTIDEVEKFQKVLYFAGEKDRGAIKNKLDQSHLDLYNEILKDIDIKEVGKMYNNIVKLEKIQSSDRTPLLEAISQFTDSDFCEKYRRNNGNIENNSETLTVNFLTDFGENQSDNNSALKELYLSYIERKIPADSLKDQEFVVNLRNQLKSKNIKINFVYYEDKINNHFYNFLELLSKSINSEGQKPLISFEKKDKEVSKGFLPMLSSKKLVSKESVYTRHSLSVSIKTPNGNIQTKNVEVKNVK
ncbi:MAG: hypothetical protein PHR61_02790 [Candidatus Absconditabacteria bacterium]|nr:hypothetical protein [Candidatus Absconditabacteria bacterium]